MKTRLTLLFMVGWFLTSLPALGQGNHKSRLEVPFSNPDRKGLLRVQSINVDGVTILGYEGKTIIVEGSLNEEKPVMGEARGPEAKGARETGIEAHEENNVVTLKTTSLENLSIRVPRSTSLQLNSTRNGNIRVENVDGEIEVSGEDGSIMIDGGSGPLLASVYNGRIIARFDSLPATKLISLRSLDGTIELTLGKEAKANVTLESYEGRVNTDFELERKQHPSVKSGIKLTGTLNGGGAEVHLATHDGRINLLTNKTATAIKPNSPTTTSQQK